MEPAGDDGAEGGSVNCKHIYGFDYEVDGQLGYLSDSVEESVGGCGLEFKRTEFSFCPLCGEYLKASDY